MAIIGTLPAGVRLDAWDHARPAESPKDSPEVAELREELRKSVPQVASLLDMLAKLVPVRDLAAQLAGPQPAKLKTQRN